MDKQARYIISGTLLLTAFLIGTGIYLNLGGTNSDAAVANWNDTDIKCLVNGHTGLSSHIHPHLSIVVDGVPESIPTNIGVTNLCMAEVHTHDASGALHIESFEAGKEFTIEDFFAVWNRELERGGYTVSVTVDGREISDPLQHVLADGEQIQITYQSLGLSAIETTNDAE